MRAGVQMEDFGEVEDYLNNPAEVERFNVCLMRLLKTAAFRPLLDRQSELVLLQPAYEVTWNIYQHPHLFEVVAAKFAFERAPSRAHFWLMPLNGSLRPENEAEQKRISDLGYIIQYGVMRAVLPDNFVRFATETGITECIDGVRAASTRLALPEIEQAPTGAPGVLKPGDPKAVPSTSGPDAATEGGAGVSASLKLHLTKSITRSVYLTHEAAERLAFAVERKEWPEAIDLAYAFADAIEGKSLQEIHEALGRHLAKTPPTDRDLQVHANPSTPTRSLGRNILQALFE